MANVATPFSGKNLAEFRVWCDMAHRQGFAFVYTTCIDILAPWWDEALQSVKHTDMCLIYSETNVTWWHGSRQSHYNDRAHNIAWICTYNSRLKHIPMLQGQELSLLERVAYIAMRFHHTKCTITHTHAGRNIYIYNMHYAQCYHTKWENKLDIANAPRVWPSNVHEK